MRYITYQRKGEGSYFVRVGNRTLGIVFKTYNDNNVSVWTFKTIGSKTYRTRREAAMELMKVNASDLFVKATRNRERVYGA